MVDQQTEAPFPAREAQQGQVVPSSDSLVQRPRLPEDGEGEQVLIDLSDAKKCEEYVEQAKESLSDLSDDKLKELLTAATSVDRLNSWLQSYGIKLPENLSVGGKNGYGEIVDLPNAASPEHLFMSLVAREMFMRKLKDLFQLMDSVASANKFDVELSSDLTRNRITDRAKLLEEIADILLDGLTKDHGYMVGQKIKDYNGMEKIPAIEVFAKEFLTMPNSSIETNIVKMLLNSTEIRAKVLDVISGVLSDTAIVGLLDRSIAGENGPSNLRYGSAKEEWSKGMQMIEERIKQLAEIENSLRDS